MSESNNTDIIIARDVHKWYGQFHALRGVSMNVKRGEVVVIFGPSGSGKSTFIRTINRLEEHQRGQIIVDGIELTNDIRNIEKIRAEVGMVFQQFNLFPHLTVLQNITLAPMWVRKWKRPLAEETARELLKRVGIAEQADKYPGQLSGGQQQRVAIARALVNDPPILLADEPTGNLDSANAEGIIVLLRELADAGKTILLITHEANLAHAAHRTIVMRDGQIVAQPFPVES